MSNPSDIEQVVANELAAKLQTVAREGVSLVLIAVMLIWFLALLGYDPRDPGWSHLSYQPEVSNFMGPAGAWWSDISFSFLGYVSYVLPFVCWYPIYRYWRKSQGKQKLVFVLPFFVFRLIGALLVLAGLAALCSLHVSNADEAMPFSAGGLWGEALGDLVANALDLVGASVILIFSILFGLSLYADTSVLQLFEALGKALTRLTTGIAHDANKLSEHLAQRKERKAAQTRETEQAARPQRMADRNMVKSPSEGDSSSAARPARRTAMPSSDGAMTTNLGILSKMGAQESSSEAVDYSADTRRYSPIRNKQPSFDEPSEAKVRPAAGFDDPFAEVDESDLLSARSQPSQAETPLDSLFDDVSDDADPLTAPSSLESLPEDISRDQESFGSSQVLSDKQAEDLMRSLSKEAEDMGEVDERPASLQTPEQTHSEELGPLGDYGLEARQTLSTDTLDDLPPFEPDLPPITLDPASVPEPQSHIDPAQRDGTFVASAFAEPEALVDEKKTRVIVPLSESHKPMKAQDLGLDERPQGESKPTVKEVRRLPSLELLDPPPEETELGYSSEQLDDMSSLLEAKLKDFNVVAEVVEVNPGPVITRFELQPAPGVKASKITNLASDLARSMAVSRVRVVEVIPGKSVIGVEIPNEHRKTVQLSEVLTSDVYQDAESHLTLALGNDIGGNPVVANLARMPHLLVAGTTGSGKSVGVNAMLLSLLFKATPEEVRLMLVDPKMLELSIYDGIPHLLTPVITDMKDAASGLRWCVAEMERRYRLMAKMGVRNLAGFNDKVKKARAQGQPLLDPIWDAEEQGHPPGTMAPELETLPYIVVVIDEFADMMMLVGKKVEELIARIAQKARAAGIHLILATQRPSVDVITGLIKANVPTRIAFQVSSKIDSRTILDQAGAENLLGWGDMLYLPPGTSLTNRVHGAFVSDDEVHRTVEAWKLLGEPEFIEDIFAQGFDPDSAGSGGSGDAEQDPLYDQAVDFVTETRKASISSVQRKFSVGYNRAARMIEAMEDAGVVTPQDGNNRREVLAPPPVRD